MATKDDEFVSKINARKNLIKVKKREKNECLKLVNIPVDKFLPKTVIFVNKDIPDAKAIENFLMNHVKKVKRLVD